jgi:hypothetical protein
LAHWFRRTRGPRSLEHLGGGVDADEAAVGADPSLDERVVEAGAAGDIEDGRPWPQLEEFHGPGAGACVEELVCDEPVVCGGEPPVSASHAALPGGERIRRVHGYRFW